jgi:uncharacterized protein (TIGR03435 family)
MSLVRFLDRSSKFILFAICVVVAGVSTHSQTPAPAPSAAAPDKVPTFDVISVKPNHSDFHGISLGYTPDGIRATNIPILFLLKESFGLNDDQMFGIPDWIHTEKYDVDAKVGAAEVPTMRNLTRDQRRQMLLQILDDRFKLTYHRETRILPEYTLVIAKGGPRLEEFKPGNDSSGQPKRGGQMKMSNGIVTAEGVPIEPLSRLLADRVGRPIIDKTGLTGNYSFKLQWADDGHDGHDGPPRGPDANAAAVESAGPSIFTALEEQLGLKLVSEKGPVQVLIVDHIEQPAAN